MDTSLATGANRNLPPQSAGSGSGVYNTVRQVGAVVGSAAIAVLMESRIVAHLPGVQGVSLSLTTTATLPPFVKTGLAAALSDAMVLPAAVLLVAFVASLFFENLRHLR